MFVRSMPARLALVGVLSVLLSGVSIAGASAQDAKAAEPKTGEAKPGAVFIVIDLDRIRRESMVGKSINADAEKYGKAIEDDNRKDEAVLRSTELELQKVRGTLPQDQFSEKARAFEQKVTEVQRTELRRRQAYEKSYNAAVIKWQQAMMDASRDVAAAHNADAVVQSQALLFYNTKWDATNEVIDLMNKHVAKVDFPPPKLEPDTGAPLGAPGQVGGAKSGASEPKQLQAQPLQAQPQPQPSGGLKLPAQ